MVVEVVDGPAVDFRPFADGFGAEVIGVDLGRPLADAVFQAVRQAFHDRRLLLFRDQEIAPGGQLAFSRFFGPLEGHVNRETRHPEHPEIQVFANTDHAGQPTGVHPEKGTLVWHTDKSYLARPSLTTMLYALAIPARGGDTLYADMHRAYEALTEEMKQRIAPLRAVHDWVRSREKTDERPATEQERRQAPPVDHPLVRTHPENGCKCLYFGNHASHILGWPRADGEALLAELLQHATAPAFVYRHEWRLHDLLMWDNRATMHKATAYDLATERRIMHRTVVRGDRPV